MTLLNISKKGMWITTIFSWLCSAAVIVGGMFIVGVAVEHGPPQANLWEGAMYVLVGLVGIGLSAISASRFLIFPWVFRNTKWPLSTTPTPLESQPRYSSFFKPLIKTGTASLSPTYPMIPHKAPTLILNIIRIFFEFYTKYEARKSKQIRNPKQLRFEYSNFGLRIYFVFCISFFEFSDGRTLIYVTCLRKVFFLRVK